MLQLPKLSNVVDEPLSAPLLAFIENPGLPRVSDCLS
jgi:hypothetical protein